jgi:hypothetical protein
MTKYSIIFALMLVALFTGTATAQIEERTTQNIQSYRAEVFTRVLDLTPEEAQQFWPIYNECLANRQNLHKKMRLDQNTDNLSDTELEQHIKDYFEGKQKELDLEKDLYQRLRKVMPARKVARLPKAERKFREEIVQKVKERREERGTPGGRNKR